MSAGEDDCDSPGELAILARDHFRAGEFPKAAEILQKLISRKENDFKSEHNLLVLGYYERNCSNPSKLFDALCKLRKKVEEAAQASEESSSSGNASADSSKPEISHGSESGDTDVSMIMYNQAVMLYQAKQYGRCDAILEELFHHIEPLDEALAVRVCFLMLDTYIALRVPDRASSVLAFVDKFIASAQNKAASSSSLSSGSNGQQIGSQPGTKNNSADEVAELAAANSTYTPQLISQGPQTPLSLIELRWHLHLYRAKLLLLTKGLKACKREVKSAVSLANTHPSALFVKGNLEYLSNNPKKSLKLLNSWHRTPSTDVSIPTLYYNNLGCLHFRMRKFHAASFYFTKALQENDAIYASSDKQDRILPAYSRDKKAEILYNMGLQLLLTSQPAMAFACFQEALLLLYLQPRLWIRLAECCIAEHVLKSRLVHQQQQKSELIKTVIGSGPSRRIVLPYPSPLSSKLQDEPPEPKPKSHPSGNGSHSDSESSLFPIVSTPLQTTLSLHYATKCLRNALLLASRPSLPVASLAPLSTSSSTAPSPVVTEKPGPSTSSQSTPQPVSSLEDHEHETSLLRLVALTDLAYVSLCISDPVSALSAADQLAALPNVSEPYRVIASLYAAEALLMLNKPSAAAQRLNPTSISDFLLVASTPPTPPHLHPHQQQQQHHHHHSQNPPPPEPSSHHHHGPFPNPYSPFATHPPFSSEARAALYVNISTLHILQSDFPQAQHALQQALTISPTYAPAILNLVYIELKKGNKDTALQLLKKRRPFPGAGRQRKESSGSTTKA